MNLQPVHRVRRFFAVATSSGPTAPDRVWAGEWMSDAEAGLFDQLRGADRAHSIAVARAVRRHGETTGEQVQDWVMASALLHDVGKIRADLGVVGRSVATVVGWVGGDRAGRWLSSRSGSGPVAGAGRAVGRYVRYPELGAEALDGAGSDVRVVAWAREHHEREAAWTVPVPAGRLLRAADDASL